MYATCNVELTAASIWTFVLLDLWTVCCLVSSSTPSPNMNVLLIKCVDYWAIGSPLKHFLLLVLRMTLDSVWEFRKLLSIKVTLIQYMVGLLKTIGYLLKINFITLLTYSKYLSVLRSQDCPFTDITLKLHLYLWLDNSEWKMLSHYVYSNLLYCAGLNMLASYGIHVELYKHYVYIIFIVICYWLF